MTIDVICGSGTYAFGQLCALCNCYADHLFEVVSSAARRVAYDFPFSLEPDERDQPFWCKEINHICAVLCRDYFLVRVTWSDRGGRLTLTNALGENSLHRIVGNGRRIWWLHFHVMAPSRIPQVYIHTSVRRRLELMQLILLPLTGALVQTKYGNIVWPSQRTTTGSNVSTWVKIAARSKDHRGPPFQGSSSIDFSSRKSREGRKMSKMLQYFRFDIIMCMLYLAYAVVTTDGRS